MKAMAAAAPWLVVLSRGVRGVMKRDLLVRVGARALLLLLSGLGLFLLVACDDSSAPPTPSASGPTATLPGPVSGAETPEGDAATPGPPDSSQLTQLANPVTPTSVPTAVGVDDAARIVIYAAVVDALLGEKLPPVVYLAPYVGEGERLDTPNEGQPLPDGLPAALSKEAPGPKYEVLDFPQAIGPLDDGGVVNNNGEFITLGAIAADSSDSNRVVVRGSWYRKNGEAAGLRLTLQRTGDAAGEWKVLDSNQEWSD